MTGTTGHSLSMLVAVARSEHCSVCHNMMCARKQKGSAAVEVMAVSSAHNNIIILNNML